MQLAADFRWTNCIATNVLALKTWYHLAATYDPAFGVRLYLDGRPAGTFPLEKRMTPPRNSISTSGAITRKWFRRTWFGTGRSFLPGGLLTVC